MRVVDKAFAYITHRDRLLVFRQPSSPGAGIQVPAGTIKSGETPRDGALREAEEETGLSGLAVRADLGATVFDMSPFGHPELHRRHFFHLEVRGEPPETWRHLERDPSHGGGRPVFEFFWVQLRGGVPELIAGHGALLPELAAAA